MLPNPPEHLHGFVVDYLAEALRELRKHYFTEVIDPPFRARRAPERSRREGRPQDGLGAREAGLPARGGHEGGDGELVELALEGRRRVEEPLKKTGSFECHQTSFSDIDGESREERFVGVPEQGGRDMIAIVVELRIPRL